MGRGYKPEQIISMLHDAGVALSQGKTVGRALASRNKVITDGDASMVV